MLKKLWLLAVTLLGATCFSQITPVTPPGDHGFHDPLTSVSIFWSNRFADCIRAHDFALLMLHFVAARRMFQHSAVECV